MVVSDVANGSYQRSFSSLHDFAEFMRSNPRSHDVEYLAALVEKIRNRGTIVTRRFGWKHVTIIGNNYREGILADGVPGRSFAMLDLLDEHTRRDSGANVLCLEGLTSFAGIIRSLYPRAVCSEFAPTEEEQKKIAPIPHVDVHDMQFAEATFDAVLSGDVFEHVPFLNVALRDCRRVLRPDGQLIATFPFAGGYESTIQRAVLENGSISHLLHPPEYHGNPVRPTEGALVFQIPGWDIIAKCKDSGFKSAEMLYISDPDRGILQADFDGLFVLRAIA
jgi:SAM-dependent methyltransferase